VDIDTVIDVQKCWDFSPLSPPGDDKIKLPHENFEEQLKFEIISGHSDEANAQRVLIDSAKPWL
jgi:hypothetical protein